jgi:hypothetical protein
MINQHERIPLQIPLTHLLVCIICMFLPALMLLDYKGSLVFLPSSDFSIIENGVFFTSYVFMIYSGAMAYKTFFKRKKQIDFNIRYHNALNFFKTEKEMNK